MTDLGDFAAHDPDDEDADGAVESSPVDDPAGAAPADDSADGADTESADDGARDDDFEPVDATPAGRDQGIGTLAVSEGLRISEERDETSLRAFVTARNRSNVRIGKYLLVPYPGDERLFCRITALEYAQEFHADDATEIHARRAMRSDGIDEADYKFIAELEPLAVLFEDGGELKRRMTDRVPKPETIVRQATDKNEGCFSATFRLAARRYGRRPNRRPSTTGSRTTTRTAIRWFSGTR